MKHGIMIVWIKDVSYWHIYIDNVFIGERQRMCDAIKLFNSRFQ